MALIGTSLQALEIVKSIGGLVKGIKDHTLRIELQQKIIDLQSAVMLTQQENASLQQENVSLKLQLAAPQGRQDLKKEYELRGNAYWKDDLPYCINCLESGNVRTLVNIDKYNGIARCSHCKTDYPDVFPHQLRQTPMIVSIPYNSNQWHNLGF